MKREAGTAIRLLVEVGRWQCALSSLRYILLYPCRSIMQIKPPYIVIISSHIMRQFSFFHQMTRYKQQTDFADEETSSIGSIHLNEVRTSPNMHIRFANRVSICSIAKSISSTRDSTSFPH